MLFDQYNLMSETEYNRYINDAAAWEADRAYWYQKAYDAQQQANWAAEFAAKYGGGGRRSTGEKAEEDNTVYLPSGSAIGVNQSNLDFIKKTRAQQNAK